MPAWLVLTYIITLGYVPQQIELLENPYSADPYSTQSIGIPERKNTVALFGFGVELFNHIRITSEIENYQIIIGLPSFNPHRVDYTFKLELYNNKLSFGVKHECDHTLYNGYYKKSYSSSETQIYIQYQGKIRL